MMANPRRIARLAELLKEEAGKILLREFDFPSSCLLTITAVESSSDLAHATILVSVLPEEAGKEILVALEEKTPYVQHLLNRKLRMRPLPKIRFILDRSAAEADTVERILQNIRESS